MCSIREKEERTVKRKYEGPYRVAHVKAAGMEWYRVVEIVGDEETGYKAEYLNPNKTYNKAQRRSAYARCTRLNKKYAIMLQEAITFCDTDKAYIAEMAALGIDIY